MRLAVTVLILAASAGTSRADDLILGSAYKNPWSSWDAYSYKRIEGQVRARTRAAVNPSSSGSGGASADVQHRPLSATDFKRVAKGRPALDRYMASIQLTGSQAAQFRAALDAALGQIELQVRKDNVATSMGVLIVASTFVLRGAEVDNPTQDRLVAGLNDVLAADPGFNKLKARDKQLMSDTMLVQASVMIMLATAGDANAKAVSQTAAREALRFLTGSELGIAP
ncbi:MAG TPA: DUF6683 family protein [Candidatus Acidoferrum sp.]|nr:DUF6683 family protein [Candidatus Acidoferrum sp.]